ncbi:MAG TPA: LysR family transcriptional regulator [Steroidobacteraceae bacterium]
MGSLRVFVAVAKHLNFTRAADALGVTASAASLQIRALEQYLARPLFRRDGRQVHLTTEGASLLPRVQQALIDIERAVDEVRGDRHSGPIKVTTLSSLLQLWLLPRMARFRAAHPEVDLHLQSSANAVDFVREDFHLAIRFGTGGWPNVRAVKLMDEWLLPVCAPALYKKHGPVRSVDDLRRYPLLHSMSEPWTTGLFEVARMIRQPVSVARCLRTRKPWFAWRSRGTVWDWGAGAWWPMTSPAAHWSPPAIGPCALSAATGWCGPTARMRFQASKRSSNGSRPKRQPFRHLLIRRSKPILSQIRNNNVPSRRILADA